MIRVYLPEKILWEEAYPTRVWLSPPVFAAASSEWISFGCSDYYHHPGFFHVLFSHYCRSGHKIKKATAFIAMAFIYMMITDYSALGYNWTHSPISERYHLPDASLLMNG